MVTHAVQACRNITVGSDGEPREIHSIQLVGNSCRIEMVKEMITEEFRGLVPEEAVEWDSDHAKSAVACGACLAAYVNEFSAFSDVNFEFVGLGDELGWEIGTFNPLKKRFDPLFFASERIRDRPRKDIPDVKAPTLPLYRRRPGGEPEFLGHFDFTRAPENLDIESPPDGMLRLLVLGPTSMRAYRGGEKYILGTKREQVAASDPFSGIH